MGGHTRLIVWLATIAGLGIAAWTIGAIGLNGVVDAARRMGVGGFLVFCGYSALVFLILGAAWLSASAGEPARRLWLFGWARAVREAVADLLPFSQLGGIVVSLRLLVQRGVTPARANAAFVADLSTEMASQLVFTLIGLSLMATTLMGAGAAALRPYILGGSAVMLVLIMLFFLGQRSILPLAAKLAERLLPEGGAAIRGIDVELARIYRDRRAVLLAFGFNLIAWTASAAGAWIALWLMGVPFPFWAALALESLIFTLRSVAFAIPGAIGVQEAAYALAGPLLGLPAETALALALAKRARDLALGLPTLIAWQVMEARAMTAQAAGGTSRV